MRYVADMLGEQASEGIPLLPKRKVTRQLAPAKSCTQPHEGT